MQESNTQTKLDLAALNALNKNGLINSQLMENWFQNRLNTVHSLGEGSRLITQEFISSKITSILIPVFTVITLVNLIRLPQDTERTQSLWILFLVGIFGSTFYRFVSSSQFVSDLKKLHRVGFAGYYKLHWEVRDLRERAEEILRNRAQAVLRYEDQPEHHREAKEKRNKFKKAHAIFLKFDLCEPKQSVYFEKRTEPVETT